MIHTVEVLEQIMSNTIPPTFPLLEQLSQMQGLRVLPSYSNPEAAQVFGCSERTIRNDIRKGLLKPRRMPGKQNFLPNDLEELLATRRSA